MAFRSMCSCASRSPPLIGRGVLAPGARLPTMREVAVALTIDLNTVQRAYAELERDGLLTMVRGRGSFRRRGAPPPRKPQADIRHLAAKVAAQAQAAGVALDELAEALRELAEARRHETAFRPRSLSSSSPSSIWVRMLMPRLAAAGAAARASPPRTPPAPSAATAVRPSLPQFHQFHHRRFT